MDRGATFFFSLILQMHAFDYRCSKLHRGNEAMQTYKAKTIRTVGARLRGAHVEVIVRSNMTRPFARAFPESKYRVSFSSSPGLKLHSGSDNRSNNR
jgi:hypothetical protein